VRIPTLKQSEWKCSLRECPPGPFILGDKLCFKISDKAYDSHGEIMTNGALEKDVQPVVIEWREINLEDMSNE
jgi:hypothetical protein